MSQPMAGLFQVLWGQADGAFKKAAVLNGIDGEPLIIPADNDSGVTEKICTRPTAVDWDGDGDLDLVVGNFAGSFYLFTGQGGGKFAPEPKKIQSDTGPLKIQGAHSDPFPVDWDGDGDLDLLSGSSNGGVQWAENSAGPRAEPKLKAFRELVRLEQPIEYGKPLSEKDLTAPAGSTRVWVDDINSDGKLDLLVGDTVTLISTPEGVTKEGLKQKQEQWNKELTEVTAEYQAAQGDQEKLRGASEKLQKLYARRSEFVLEQRTGFVWLYLQR
jgi:hypothetical protein